MRTTLTLVAALVLATGCGEDDKPRAASTTEAAATAQPKGELPAELIGTWTTTLKVSDIEDSPNEFIGADSVWKLALAPDGGVDGAPAFTLSNPKIGPISSATWTASAAEITTESLEDSTASASAGSAPACNGGTTKAVYQYALSGNELTLQPTDMGDCPPHPAIQAVLTTNPWKKG